MEIKPNFLFIQADQLASRILPAYGNKIAKTPHIDQLAKQGVVFEHAYCNYPLCSPSRFSMMSGLLPTNAGAYDNGAEFPASLPTFAHYLRLSGYQTCLSGKMHFIGPDQLHGFEERVTTDIYPSDFNWTANWSVGQQTDDGNRLLAAAGEAKGVTHSGIYERTIQLDYDDEVAFKAVRKIHDIARSDDDRPFCLFVSFTHPHDPFAMPKKYWDRYEPDEIDMPAIPRPPREELDSHSQRLFDHIGVAEAAMDDGAVRVARHAYYAAVSYIDDQVGLLIDALESAQLDENTIVVFLSDHGEALGERGLWFKRSFFDCALQVPLIVSAPAHFLPARVDSNVSLVDILPTVVDFANPESGTAVIETRYDGKSIRPLLEGSALDVPNRIFAEMTGDCLQSPAVMVIEDRYKYIYCATDPAQLYDLANDKHEQKNLAGQPDVAEIEARLSQLIFENWNMAELTQRVLENQKARLIVDKAHALGKAPAWDYDASVPGREQYFRPNPTNLSSSNYNSKFEVRMRPDSEKPNIKTFPK
jgi:choline-sulfatase